MNVFTLEAAKQALGAERLHLSQQGREQPWRLTLLTGGAVLRVFEAERIGDVLVALLKAAAGPSG